MRSVMAGEPRSRESKSMKLTLDEYQARCGDTANYPEAGTGSVTAITYCVLGLAGEAGRGQVEEGLAWRPR